MFKVPGYRLDTVNKHEINNYLGNVNALLTDRKLATGATPNLFEAVVTMTSDYYPFGMQMPGRHTQNEDYRYAYNGMEQDKEVSGNGNSYTTEFRQYDPRLGRWKSLDPLMAIQPFQSPYQAFNNNPIFFVDPFGLIGGPAKEFVSYDVNAEPKQGTNDRRNYGDWWWTPTLTHVEKGVGGMRLNITKHSRTEYYGAARKKARINSNPPKGIESGMVKKFDGQDGTTYGAEFDGEGNFVGYKSPSTGEAYDNKEYTKNTVLKFKVEQAMEYFKNKSTFRSQNFEAPSFLYSDRFSMSKFYLRGQRFNGSVQFVTHSFGNSPLNFDRYLDFLYIKDSGIDGYNGTYGNTAYTVAILTRYSGGQQDPVIVFSFQDKAEWIKFVKFLKSE